MIDEIDIKNYININFNANDIIIYLLCNEYNFKVKGKNNNNPIKELQEKNEKEKKANKLIMMCIMK